ncbi:hypothetical protein RhiirA5_506147 [Rhizophagus irregularis]|uniref:Uncharacterized protein n=1 Tax=Rhizophagus irregularis TaxID=588596 RepID=A0A2N0NVE6_9GLOM|nr:hypothetical protein RhiirA5_506147 [Rhizophagus irregularis]
MLDVDFDAYNVMTSSLSIWTCEKLDQAYAEVEAAVSAGTLGTPGQIGSLSRRNSYFFDDDAAYFSSSPLSASPLNAGNNRASFSSRPPIPPGWLNLQPCEKVLEQTNERWTFQQIQEENIPRKSSNGRRLKRPSNGPSTPSTPSTPKDSRQSSSTSMGFHLESGGDGPRDSGYFSSGDKRRSQSSMARRAKDITAAYYMRQSSYGRNSPNSDDAASEYDQVKVSVCQTHSSTAKKYNGERRGSVASITSVSSVTRGYLGGVEDTLAALEGRREEYAKSPELKVQA